MLHDTGKVGLNQNILLLNSNTIPIHARILSVAEAFDSMTHNHYKEPISVSDAVNELVSHSATQFDEEIVKVFIEKVVNPGNEKQWSGTKQLKG